MNNSTLGNTLHSNKGGAFRKMSGYTLRVMTLSLIMATVSMSTLWGQCGSVPSSISGFIYMGEHNGSKYFCSDDNNNSWADAMSEIAGHGGHLVVINNAAENEFIKNTIQADYAWIGYTDEASEGNFDWVNGDDDNYTNWEPGEPNNGSPSGGYADYTVINKNSGKWYDRNGNDHYEYVMEIPCPAFPPAGATCFDEIVNWDLENCYSTTGGSNAVYTEFTPSITTPGGCGGNVDASIVYRDNGNHSCTPGYDGNVGMCVGTHNTCTFVNDDEYALRFDVTIDPPAGGTASLSGLSFYEKAPYNYDWIGGASGPNDYPTKYGIRVTVNGSQVYKEVNISTQQSWNLETFDFSNDADFTVSSTTTFSFELRGYCRVGNGASQAVWDLDDIKAYGCCEGPCASAGGDSDGDGVCNDDDCAPNDSTLPASPGTACNDGNPNTVNDEIQADGCTCAGTFDPCATSGGDSDGDGVCNNDDCAPNDSALPATPGTPCDDGNPGTLNDEIQADGCTCMGTSDPCALLGGDSDGDGVCDLNDCAPNDSTLPATPGTACNDGNPNTTNDEIQGDGCTCLGDPIPPVCDNVTIGGTIGFGGSCAYSVQVCNTAAPQIENCTSPAGGSGDFEIVWLKATNNPNCVPPSTTVDNLQNDPYWSLVVGETGLTLDPGTVTEKTCYLRCTRRAGCTTYIESNIISVDIDPACGGGGDPDCADISITTGSGSITVSGLDGAPVSSLQIFNSSWGTEFSCFADCGATETVNLPAGDYLIFAKYYSAGYGLICQLEETVTVGGGPSCSPGSPCDDGDLCTINDTWDVDCNCVGSADADLDGDGTCDAADCQPNNANFPATPGSACDDGNPNTTNDQVTADGCGCAGTTGGGGDPDCADINITTDAGSITVSGLDGAPVSSLQIFNSSWGTEFSCFADCGATETVNLPAGDYLIFAKYYTAGYGLICQVEENVTVGGGGGPCTGQGGDSDGDGICDNDDCQPNNANYPATPGTACDDGNPNTENDQVNADGCGCEGTPIQTGDCTPETLATWSLDACASCTSGTNADWTELTSSVAGVSGCVSVNASDISPVNSSSTHSCTPGQSGTAMCVGSGVNFEFEVVMNGDDGALTGISFYEQAPDTYVWDSPNNNCGGAVTGTNNPPTMFRLKVYKNGVLVYNTNNSTQSTWNLRNFDFSGDPNFEVNGNTVFRFVIKPNSPAGTGSVAAWDIDEISVMGCCGNTTPTCDNVTDGGQIAGDESGCAGYDPAPISVVSAPSGGSGTIEYLWLSSTTGCPTQISQGIPNSNVASFNPGPISQTTYYVRCSRRAGCAVWTAGESNCVVKTVAGSDSDGDGVCDNDDCQPNNANFPATPGSACDDGNPNTNNDQVTADGCGCEGTPGGGDPDCADITITTDAGSITVSGLDGAPVSSLQIFNSSWGTEFSCFADCGATETVNLPAGDYLIFAKYYTAGYGLICQIEENVTVGGGNPCAGQGGDSDGDGTCDNDDCQPNNANFPATPGSACDDGNANTQNDQVTADGCGCEGTPITGPCAGQGGDSDGDGVCDNDDCQPNNANFPATPGSACDDGNSNTENDQVTADGCGCEGTPVSGPDCANINITTGSGSITVNGLDGAPVSSLQIFNSSWGTEFSCFADCGATETVNLPAGDYLIFAKYYTAGYGLICQIEENVTVTGGGCDDADSDGTCDADDCQPNNANFPATPGTACDDGNPNTENDQVTADGCGCQGTPVGPNVCTTRTASNSKANCGNGTSYGFYADNMVSGISEGARYTIQNASFEEFDNGTATLTARAVSVNNSNVKFDISATLSGRTSTAPTGSPKPSGCYTINTDDWYYYTTLTGTLTGLNAVAGGEIQISLLDDIAFQVGTGANLNDENYFGGSSWLDYTVVSHPSNSSYSFYNGVQMDFNIRLSGDGGDPCQPSGPCAGQGGDSDGDGVCDNSDCQPNNANFPATPGSACNDGNPDTENDEVTADGCGCEGTPIPTGCTPSTLVTWSLDACASCTSGSNADWSELTANVAGNGGCSNVTATGITPVNNSSTHSCTPGQTNTAMCIGSDTRIEFEVSMDGNSGSLSGLSFYEKAPHTYVWDSPNNNCGSPVTGTNNPPSKFDLNIYKDGSLVYSSTENTQSDWNLRTFDFSGNTDFDVDGPTTFRFELKPHTPTGSGSVKAWDLDEVSVMGCCDGNSGGGGTGGTGDCANINITTGPGSVTVSGLDGAPVTSLQVFSTDWTTQHFNCFSDCNATETISLPAGDYIVLAKYYDASWQPACEVNTTVTVNNYLLGNGVFDFDAAKHEEHAELIWLHNNGENVLEYTLERSLNGVDFEPVISQLSKGGNETEVYQGYDFEPVYGDNFYRVRLELTDGRVDYSHVEVVNFPDLAHVLLFPNPANQFVKANLEDLVGHEDVTITIFNNLGTAMKQFELDEVHSKYYQMDIRDLREGHYVVWFDIPGRRSLAKKLVVGKF